MRPVDCPFCTLPLGRISEGNHSAVCIDDAYPVSLGHSLLIPRRHVPSLFDLTREERTDIFDLLDRVHARIQAEHNPDGFNVGINDGAAAGQTVMHLHVHLIPRYDGDRPDPRGGVRWIFPEKVDYWSAK